MDPYDIQQARIEASREPSLGYEDPCDYVPRYDEEFLYLCDICGIFRNEKEVPVASYNVYTGEPICGKCMDYFESKEGMR